MSQEKKRISPLEAKISQSYKVNEPVEEEQLLLKHCYFSLIYNRKLKIIIFNDKFYK